MTLTLRLFTDASRFVPQFGLCKKTSKTKRARRKMRPCHVLVLQRCIGRKALTFIGKLIQSRKVHCQPKHAFEFDKLHPNLFRNSLQEGKHKTLNSPKIMFANEQEDFFLEKNKLGMHKL